VEEATSALKADPGDPALYHRLGVAKVSGKPEEGSPFAAEAWSFSAERVDPLQSGPLCMDQEKWEPAEIEFAWISTATRRMP